MEAPRPRGWFRAALLLGVVYLVVGRLFALPAEHVRAWRLAAWIVCGGAYAAHFAYEHFVLRNAPLTAAWHIAVGVAIGAVMLAVAAMIHSLSSGLGVQLPWLLALVLWPAITAGPAFIVAFVAGAVLWRLAPPVFPGPEGR